MQVFHGERLLRLDRRRQRVPQRYALGEWNRWQRAKNRRRRDGRRRNPGSLLDYFAYLEELRPRLTGFVDGRVVVVAGHVRLIVVAIRIGAAEPAETGAAEEHVHADGVALLEHPADLRDLLRRVGVLVLRAPVIEPAGPVFCAEIWPLGTQLAVEGKGMLGFSGAEVDRGGQIGEGAPCHLLSAV